MFQSTISPPPPQMNFIYYKMKTCLGNRDTVIILTKEEFLHMRLMIASFFFYKKLTASYNVFFFFFLMFIYRMISRRHNVCFVYVENVAMRLLLCIMIYSCLFIPVLSS